MPSVVSEYTIRKATEKDIKDIQQLIHTTIRHSYSIAYPKGVVDFFLDYHNEDFIRENLTKGTNLLLFTDNRMIATIYLSGNTMGGMYVQPEYQGKGFGRILFEKLLELAREQKLDHVILDSTLHAKKLYDSFGFETLDFVFQPMDNGDRLYYFKMRKNL